MTSAKATLGLRPAMALLLAAAVAACGNSGGGGGSSTGGGGGGGAPECAAGESFNSTFEGIQKLIFEKHGCTQDVCHGSSAQGGLNLSPDVAYKNLIEVPSGTSTFPRVVPGDKTRSYLWLKLAAGTNPGSVEINGAPMPNGLPAISADELEAVRLWIYAGAPETGTVGGTEKLLNACLPTPEPITIKPLDPPAASEGFQLVLPEWKLEAHSEHELCFATYYDISKQVPADFQDPSGQMYRFSGFELRQDPQSHHLILYFPAENFQPGGVNLKDPSFGTWRCAGGEHPGDACEPTDLAACGSGYCISEPQNTFACVGYGPTQGLSIPIGGAQQSQALALFPDGVFAQLPMKGVLFWNSHAFNLTNEDTVMHGRLNYTYAKQQTYAVDSIFDTSAIFKASTPPYQKETVCNTHTVPQGTRLFEITSHTHKHGKHFTVDGPDGKRLYDSFTYNDPVRQKFDPPLVFDSPDAAQRTLTYCSLYNNGMNDDGSPNPDAVTRSSKVPSSAAATVGRCKPIACVAGKVGAPCSGSSDGASCDSTPGAGDGVCDACKITGGESTENEMFILFGSAYRLPVGTSGVESAASAEPGWDAAGRSLSTEPAFPGYFGCANSPGGHAGHAAVHGEH